MAIDKGAAMQAAMDAAQLRSTLRFTLADARAQKKYIRGKYGLEKPEMERQHGYKMALQGDQMNARGLNFSGIRQAGQARGLGDITHGQAMMELEKKYELDAIKRAMKKARSDYSIGMMGVGASLASGLS